MRLVNSLTQRIAELEPSDRRALLIVTVFLIAIGGYVYVVEPLVIGYQNAQSTIIDLSEKQRRYRRQVKLLPRREQKLAEYNTERLTIERRFNLQMENPEAAVARTITELTYYARLVNVTVSSIRPLEGVSIGGLMEIPFEIEAMGGYEELRKFFYYIDTSPSLLAITDLDLSLQTEDVHLARLKLSDVISLQSENSAVITNAIEPQNQLRLLLSHWTGFAPLVVAKANGYLESDSLRVDLLQIDDNITIERLLASGEVDAIGTNLLALLEYWVKGIPLSVVMPLDRTTGTEGIVVRPDSEIRVVADLWQQRIAVDEQGLLQFVLYQALAAHDMKLSDIELESLAASQVARDIGSGTLEIGVTREPYLSELLNNDLARVIYTSDETEGVFLDLLAITPEAATEKSDVIQLLIDGVHKAQQFIIQQPEKALEIVAEWQGQPVEITRVNLAKLTSFNHETAMAFFAEDQLTSLLNTYETYFNTISKPFPLLTRDDIVDGSFLDQVLRTKQVAVTGQ